MAVSKRGILVVATLVAAGVALIAAMLWRARDGEAPAGNAHGLASDRPGEPPRARSFEEVYGLAGKTAKRVVPPFGPERLAFFKGWGPAAAHAAELPEGPDVMLVIWREGKPELLTYQWSSGGLREGEKGYILMDLIQSFTGFTPMDVDSDPRMMSLNIPGDIVLDGAATEEEKLAALEQLVWEAIHKRVAIKEVETQQDVIVLKGQWKYMPVAGHSAGDAVPAVEVYGADLNREKKAADTGAAPIAGWSGVLSYHVGRPVEVAATGAPAKLRLLLNYDGDGSPESKAKARDVDLVVQHLCEQTGLERTVETRKRRRLVMSATTELQLP